MSEQTELFPAHDVLPLWWYVPNAQDSAAPVVVDLDGQDAGVER